MSRLAVAALALALGSAGCTCKGGSLLASAGELVFLTSDGAGGELQSHDGQVTVPDVAMDEVGAGEVRLRNVGNGPLTIQRVVPRQGETVFTLVDLEGLTLEAGAEAVATVRFAPPQHADSTVARVEHRASFGLELVGTRAENAHPELELSSGALARDCFVPAEVDFGEVSVGLRVSVPFALENGKQHASQVTFSAVNGEDPAFFELGATPGELAPGARAEVPLWFGPSAERTYRATVDVQRSGCSPVTVMLKGRGVRTSLAWAPASLDFGKVPLGQTTPTQTVSVTNNSNATLHLTMADAGVDYVVDAPTVVAAHGVTKVQLACRPTTLGRLPSTLEFSLDTSPVTPVRVPLTCQGGGPRVRVMPSPLNLGVVPMVAGNAPSSIRRLTVQNVGTPPNFPQDTSNNLVLGFRGQPPVVSIVPMVPGVEPGEFEVVVPSSYPAEGLPAVAGSNGVDLDVLFRPRSTGLKQVEVRVYTNDALTPVSRVVVSAEAVTASLCGTLRVTPATLAFGDAPRGGSLTRSITVQNLGAACTLSGFDLTPGSSSVFSMVDTGTTILVPALGSAVVRVKATIPGTAEVGAVERGYARFFAPTPAPVMLVPLEVRVASCLVFSPSALDFGFTALGCRSAEQPLSLYNTCGVPMTLEQLAVAPEHAPFTITSGPAVDAPIELTSGSAMTWGITFSPDAGADQPVTAQLEATVAQAGVRRVVQVPLVGQPVVDGRVVERFQQGSGDLDILFVVDDSCSMADEQTSLATNFDSFIRHAVSTNSNFNLAVTTTDTFNVNGAFRGSPGILTPRTPSLNSAFASRAIAGISGSGFERPFDALLRALTPPMSTGPNAGFLRAHAPLAAIIVTDAIDQSPLSVSAYLAQLRALKGNRADLVNVSVVGPFTQPSATCLLDGLADTGRYTEIIRATGGVKTDICTTNWARDLDVIGSSLLGLTRRFPLKTRPDLREPVVVTVNGVQQTTGWTLETRDNAISFSVSPPSNAEITVTYRTPCF